MASRKEQKEALRREREAREAKARGDQRRKQMMGYGVAGAIALVAVVVVVALVIGSGGGGGESSASSEDVYPGGGSVPAQKVTDLNVAAKDAGCTLKSDPNDSAKHTQSLSTRVKYRTNPPTSGSHYVQPPSDGAYAEPLQDEQFVHSQEHGRIVIWFKPTLPAKDRADLKALFDEDDYQMVITPRAKMPYEVAATAWNATPGKEGTGRLLLCDKMAEPQVFDAIRSFRDENRGNGPEPVP
jgi:uncharacterized protein DUF3105